MDETASKLDQLVGRRFPFLIIFATLTAFFAGIGRNELAATALGILGIVAKGYFDDLKAEKTTA